MICWAITVAHVVEALYNKYNSKDPVSLSPQELINCAFEEKEKENPNPKSREIKVPTRLKPVYDHIIDHGLSKEEDCSFKGPKEVDRRNFVRSDNPIRIASSFEVADDVDEMKLLERVAEHPVVGVIESHSDFNNLKKDEYYEGPTTPVGGKNGVLVLHCVLIVGYGTDFGPDGEPIHYWLVRNSDGYKWADKGYGKIKRKISLRGKKSVFIRYSYPIMPSDMVTTEAAL